MPKGVFLILLLFSFFPLYAQLHEQGSHPYVIRGEVFIDLEPIYAGFIDPEYPLDFNTARLRALEETAMLFSAMIYGWSFYYDVGERARLIEENLELYPISLIQPDDPSLKVTDTEIRDMRLRMWADYQLSDAQQRQMQVWRTGTIRTAQAIGYGPAYLSEYPGWLEIKKMALEDAARLAIRTMLAQSERNRPKEVTGFIGLSSFPRYYIESGRWAVSGRFYVQITEIIPFAVY